MIVKKKKAVKALHMVREAAPRDIIGKEYNPERDGVTFSLLSKFINCRELALHSLQRWAGKRVSGSMLYGTLVHAVNERVYGPLATGKGMTLEKASSLKFLHGVMDEVEAQWKKENPQASAESVQTFQDMARLVTLVMPYYFRFWPNDFKLQWEKVEHVFTRVMEVPGYSVSRSGLADDVVWRVPIRGKMDGLYDDKGRRLLETKTKSQMGEQGETVLVDTMPFELQVGTYLSSLYAIHKIVPAGVRYNLIRKPGIEQRKGETPAAFAQRLTDDIRKRPDFYFVRLRMDIDKRDVTAQEMRLQAVVRSFMMWYHGIDTHYPNSAHCQNKYGTCNMLKLCSNGDTSALFKRPVLFSELEEGGL